jgi:tripartite-type tricarboxylate transporter receptor subunit TctC
MNGKRVGIATIVVVLVLNAVMVFAAGGAQSQGGGSGEWKWERKVTLVCPWGVGGGADGTLRPLQPLLQEILGVPVEIVNVEGAGGANGVTFVSRQPADGYTYLLGTQAMIMMDLQKILPVDWQKDFRPVAKLVHSINILASSKKAMAGKYSNFSEFIAYAKSHPKELNCATQTTTGTDSVALKQTLAEGLKVKTAQVDDYIRNINYASGAEISSAMVGGHVFVAITGADEVRGLIQSGDIVPLISMSEKRMSSFPDIQCTNELGVNSYVGTWRGLYARSSTPQAATDSLTKALEKAWNMPAYQEFLRQASYLDRPGFADGPAFKKLMDAEYPIFEDFLRTAGIIK